LKVTIVYSGATGEVILSKSRFEKLFSPDEANRLIPRLEIIMRDLQLMANFVRTRINELAAEDPDLLNRTLPEIVELHPDLDEPSTRMAQAVEQIEELGCFLKDIDQGLVDFPFDNGEEVVFLCWQFGEQSVIAWHPMEGGFEGRRPLPGAPKPWLN
jgi:hypothetical protein